MAIAGNEQLNELADKLAAMAKQYQVHMVAGTMPFQAPNNKVVSRCYVFDDQGMTLDYYDKIHLFDVDVADGTRQYRESDTFAPGDRITVVDTPFGKIGLAICYDLRFADLFRALRIQGAELITLPSAFTKVTGEAHWQVLLQARAIESQCFVLGANQWGSHNQGSRETYGHSMVVDPWGKVSACKPEGTGWLQVRPDLQQLQKIRQNMPVLGHNRFIKPELTSS